MKKTVRCPYCVLGIEFRPMIGHVDGRFICDKCGHTTVPMMPATSATASNAYRWWLKLRVEFPL